MNLCPDEKPTLRPRLWKRRPLNGGDRFLHRCKGAMVRVGEIWRRVTASRYTRGLEAEVVRLRAENRALLNSILGIAGVPPICVVTASMETFGTPVADLNVDAAKATKADDTSRRDPSLLRSIGMTVKSETRGGRGQTASPMRRRSWQQIHRALEFESARKKEKHGDANDGTSRLGVARIRA